MMQGNQADTQKTSGVYFTATGEILAPFFFAHQVARIFYAGME